MSDDLLKDKLEEITTYESAAAMDDLDMFLNHERLEEIDSDGLVYLSDGVSVRIAE